MAYGSVLTDVVQSSVTGTPPQFNDGAGTQTGTLCRAWVNFAGASGTRNASFNVSSVTRNGTGDYTVNFTNALSDANYSAVLTGGFSSAVNHYTYPAISNSSAPSTTTLRIYNALPFSPWINDSVYICVSIFR
jgi:hypothetical protein